MKKCLLVGKVLLPWDPTSGVSASLVTRRLGGGVEILTSATIGWSVAPIPSARWDLCFDDIIFLEDDIDEIIEKLSECQIGMI